MWPVKIKEEARKRATAGTDFHYFFLASLSSANKAVLFFQFSYLKVRNSKATTAFCWAMHKECMPLLRNAKSYGLQCDHNQILVHILGRFVAITTKPIINPIQNYDWAAINWILGSRG